MPKQKRGLKGSADEKGRSNKQEKMGNNRTAATVRRLNMYKRRPIRDKHGKVTKQEYQSKELPNTRIVPDRRWFGNTRVVGQEQLSRFREEMADKVNSPFTVLIKQKKLPLSLLQEPKGTKRTPVLGMESFEDTFGAKKQRKRVKLAAVDLESMVEKATEANDEFADKVENKGHATLQEQKQMKLESGEKEANRERGFDKGQSRRIWSELYKVVDSSDVVVQVLDARDPQGTRCKQLEKELKGKDRLHKHMILLINKCDLVPASITKKWLRVLSQEYPTLAFHSSLSKPFGKGALLSLLRQLSRFKNDKQAITVGFVGYPNVGKSSVINTLRTRKVCNVAPLPGETKVWQYITLSRKLYLLDCPGVVYHSTDDSKTDTVLKGVVRVPNLDDATEHIGDVLKRCKHQHIVKTYGISEWEDKDDFLTQLAISAGKLLRGGEPDLNTAAKMMLQDWQRGKLPFFTTPSKELMESTELAEQEAELAEEAAMEEEAAGDVEEAKESDYAIPSKGQEKKEPLQVPKQDLASLPHLQTDADEEDDEDADGEAQDDDEIVDLNEDVEDEEEEDSSDDEDDLTWEAMLGSAIGGDKSSKETKQLDNREEDKPMKGQGRKKSALSVETPIQKPKRSKRRGQSIK